MTPPCAATDASVVGVARARTRAAPQPRATLELEHGGTIDFIPTNRSAIVRFASAEDHARLVLLPLDGVYDVQAEPGATGASAASKRGGRRSSPSTSPTASRPSPARSRRPTSAVLDRSDSSSRSERRTCRRRFGHRRRTTSSRSSSCLCGGWRRRGRGRDPSPGATTHIPVRGARHLPPRLPQGAPLPGERRAAAEPHHRCDAR